MNKTLEKLRHLRACPESLRYVKDAGDCDTLTLLCGARAEWVAWLAAKVLPGDRRVVHAASACARAVMHKARSEDVSSLASTLDLVDRWCAGGDVSVEKLRAAAWAAWADAARATAADAARATARATARAADAAVAADAARARAADAARYAHSADPSVDLNGIIDAVLPLEEIAAAFDALTVDLAHSA